MLLKELGPKKCEPSQKDSFSEEVVEDIKLLRLETCVELLADAIELLAEKQNKMGKQNKMEEKQELLLERPAIIAGTLFIFGLVLIFHFLFMH